MFQSLKDGLLGLPAGMFFYGMIFKVLPCLFFVYYFSNVLLPFLIAVVIAYVIISVNEQLNVIGVPPRFSMPFVALVLFLLAGVASLYLGPLVWKQSVNFAMEIPLVYSNLKDWAVTFVGVHIGDSSQQSVRAFFEHLSEGLIKGANVIANNTFGSLISVASMSLYVVIIPILVFFFVRDKDLILTYFNRFLSDANHGHKIALYWNKIDEQLRSYVQGKMIEMLVVGLIALGLFSVVGLKYSVLLATAVGVSVLIPFVGAFIVTVPVLAVAFTQFGLSNEFAFVAGGYLILQILDGNLLVPIIFSEKMKIHPIAILMSVLLFGSVGGIAGVFFAIPLLASLKICIEMKYPAH